MARAKPSIIRSPGGDEIAVSIGATGQTTMRSTDPREAVMGRITVRGMTPVEAKGKSRGFWGRLWDGIKAAVKRVIDVITFDVGGASCRGNVSVGTKPRSVSIGISCTN